MANYEESIINSKTETKRHCCWSITYCPKRSKLEFSSKTLPSPESLNFPRGTALIARSHHGVCFWSGLSPGSWICEQNLGIGRLMDSLTVSEVIACFAFFFADIVSVVSRILLQPQSLGLECGRVLNWWTLDILHQAIFVGSVQLLWRWFNGQLNSRSATAKAVSKYSCSCIVFIKRDCRSA